MATTDSDGQRTLDKFQDAVNLATKARTGLSENNGRLIELNQRVQSIRDPKVRATLTARIQAHVARQAQIAGFYRSVAQKIDGLRTMLRDWLAKIGIKGVPGLGELGVLPAVPAAIVAVLIAAGIAAGVVITANSLHGGAIEQTAKVVDQVTKGQMTADDGAKLIEALSKQADSQMDALGIKGAVHELVPILAIAAAVLLLPNILSIVRELTPRSRAA